MVISPSRERFIECCNSVLAALSNLGALQASPSSTPGSSPTPQVVDAIVVQGLTVVFYASFEDYLTQISLERLKTLNPLNVSSDLLPGGLKKEMAEGAMRTLVARLKFLPKDEVQKEVASEAQKIASASTMNNYAFSKYMFMPSTTNVSTSDIAAFLKKVCVADPWRILSDISSQVGNGSPSLLNAVQADAKRRNEAAHEGGQSITAVDLDGMVRRLRAVALAYELIINASLTHIENGLCIGSQCELGTSSLPFDILNIERRSASSFGVLRDRRGRALRRLGTLPEAVDYALQQLRGRNGIVVLRAPDGMAVEWWL